jgi:ketosteroid isomerase-like protein
MEKRIIVSLLLSLIFVPALAESQPPSETETAIRGVSTEFISAFNKLDWEKFKTFFDDRATVIHPAQFPRRVEGKQEVEKAWLEVFSGIRTDSGKSSPPYMHLEPRDLEIQMLDNVAIVTFHLDRGNNSIGRRTLVWHKTPAGWKIVHLHASNVDLDTRNR